LRAVRASWSITFYRIGLALGILDHTSDFLEIAVANSRAVQQALDKWGVVPGECQSRRRGPSLGGAAILKWFEKQDTFAV
jgi:hypothetical protein